MSIVMSTCFECEEKITPHEMVEVRRTSDGELHQAMKCTKCGALSDVNTGEALADFLEIQDAPIKTDADVDDEEEIQN